MAYIDPNARAKNPASLFGAVAINALLVGGVILAAPDLIKEPPWKIVEMIRVAPPPPPSPVIDRRPDTQTPKPQPFAPKPDRATAAESDNDLAIPPGPGDFGAIPGTGGGTIIEQPPQSLPHIPVLTGARVHPRYTGVLQPEYPPGEIRAGREGSVIVRVLVGTDGRVKAVEPISSDGDAFLAVTRKQALGKWRFLPATRDGEPVEAWREMTVRFRLPD